ncbi:MAG: glycine cleavage system aminomethyltransferase T/glycine, partial [Cellvibrionaceae bacterium]
MKANIIVIGGGIVGTSVAYHLIEAGVEDVLLLDKGDLDHNDGSTSHAPGGLRTLTPSKFFTVLGQGSRAVYDKLPLAIEGQEQFFRTGMMQIANTKARFDSYKRMQEMGMTMGVEAQLMTPAEVNGKLPLVDASTIYGGVFIPDSGAVKTSLLATSMRREAEKTGRLTAHGDTQVIDIVVENGRVRAVLTDNPEMPRIDCDQVVLASNIWAPILAEKIGVPMPLFPGEHQYIYTDPTPALDDRKQTEHTFPITAFDDLSIYFRQHHDRIGIGSYHHAARLVDPHKLGKNAMNDFTAEDFTEAWKLMQGHMPALKNTKVSHGFNGLFAFTADHYPIMGESHVKGFWSAVGMWLSFASEAGKVMARWMTTGDPGMDMRSADINRFHPYHSNREYLSRQSKYYYEIGFDILHPNEVASSVRNLRHSPYHSQLEKLGGEFIPLAGIESPYWYNSNQDLADNAKGKFPERTGYDATAWSPIIGAEVLAMRESVGIVDWSAAIGPIEISGPNALGFLNHLTTTNVDRKVGRVAYGLMLNQNGKIMRDVTVLRRSEDTFWLLTGKSNMPAELFWIKQQAAEYAKDGGVKIVNRAEEFSSIGLWGPNARKVLEKVTHADVSNGAFPWYTAQDIGVGMTPATAIRISYVGELGWEIYAPVSYGSQMWDALWDAGQEFGIRPTGVAALMAMRIEKGYKLFGADLTPDDDPYSAGMGWAVNTKKGEFIGRYEALHVKDYGAKQKQVLLTFDDPNAIMYGYEPV